MNSLVVYFHGYGSSSNTDKVARLQDQLPNSKVVAFDIDVNPKNSIPDLIKKIDQAIINEDVSTVIFVGTSLGAWYAGTLGEVYGVHSVLINPCLDPNTSLRKYNVAESICENYYELEALPSSKYFCSLNDEVIDHSPLLSKNFPSMSVYDKADHRFNGPEFEDVIQYVKDFVGVSPSLV